MREQVDHFQLFMSVMPSVPAPVPGGCYFHFWCGQLPWLWFASLMTTLLLGTSCLCGCLRAQGVSPLLILFIPFQMQLQMHGAGDLKIENQSDYSVCVPDMWVCMYVYVCTCSCKCANVHMHMCRYSYDCECVHICMCSCEHVYVWIPPFPCSPTCPLPFLVLAFPYTGA